MGIQEKNKRTRRVEFEDEEMEEEKSEEKPEQIKPAIDILKDIETNEWLTGVDDDTSNQVAANIEEAIELNGKKKIDSGGIMKLSEIVTTQEGEEEDNDDGLTEMERELQDALKMKQNRVGALDISDEENSEDEIDASKIESLTARIEKRQKEIQENEEMEAENGE